MSGIPGEKPDFDDGAIKIANSVYAVVNYRGTPTKIILGPQKTRFLSELFKPNTTLAEACERAGVKPEVASKWLKEKKIKEYLMEICNKIAVTKGQNIEDFVNEMWAAWRGERELTETQKWAGDKLGKILGIYKERVINESYTELTFVQKTDDGTQLGFARNAEISGPMHGQIHLPAMRQAVGQVNTDNLQGYTPLPEA